MTPTWLTKPFNKLAAWVVYKAFIYFSRHVSFQDFQHIWNQAYKAHVEAEWKKMIEMGIPRTSGTSSMLTNRLQVEQAAEAEVKPSRRQQEPILQRGGLNVG